MKYIVLFFLITGVISHLILGFYYQDWGRLSMATIMIFMSVVVFAVIKAEV